MPALRGRDRLIVALDVPTVEEALDLVATLGHVSFFKIGWQLFVTGRVPELLDRLATKRIFIDLKVPGDIDNTIRSVVEFCVAADVALLTLSESVFPATITAARQARGDHWSPRFLTVPFLSSMDEQDLAPRAPGMSVNDYIRQRAAAALDAGCDGIIASGQAIEICRRSFGPDPLIVSPGIRPAGSSTDDHKRLTTPADAIRAGADYLVVGRPIRSAAHPREAAQQIIDEIDSALGRG